MTKEELKTMTMVLINRIGEVSKIKLGRIGRFDPTAIREAYQLIFDSVKGIEEYSKAYSKLSGNDKKEVVVSILCEYISIPWCPPFLKKILFTWTINFIVYAFNRIGGKEWIDNLFGRKEG